MALDGRLRRGEAAPAVVLAIHAELTGLARGLGVVRPEVAPHGREAKAGRNGGKDLPARVEELIGRDHERRGHVLEAPLAPDAARLREPQRVAGAAATLAVEAGGGGGALPGGAVVARNDHVDVCHLVRPGAQRVQAALPLGEWLDVGVGPADRGLIALRTQQPHRLERARPAARVKQQRCHETSVAKSARIAAAERVISREKPAFHLRSQNARAHSSSVALPVRLGSRAARHSLSPCSR